MDTGWHSGPRLAEAPLWESGPVLCGQTLINVEISQVGPSLAVTQSASEMSLVNEGSAGDGWGRSVILNSCNIPSSRTQLPDGKDRGDASLISCSVVFYLVKP